MQEAGNLLSEVPFFPSCHAEINGNERQRAGARCYGCSIPLCGVDLAPHQEFVEETITVEDTTAAPPSAYGIPLSGFCVDRSHVKPGSTFSNLLAPLGISAACIDTLVRLAAPLFDVNRIRAGHPLAFIFPDDDSTMPAYFVYEANAVDRIVFDLRSPYDVRLEKRPIHTEEKSLSVEVTGALWNDLVAAGATPALAAELSKVFAWTVDFYRIRKATASPWSIAKAPWTMSRTAIHCC